MLDDWRDVERVSETYVTTSYVVDASPAWWTLKELTLAACDRLSPRPRRSARNNIVEPAYPPPSREASKYWRHHVASEEVAHPFSPSPSAGKRSLPSNYSASLHITSDPPPHSVPMAPSTSSHSVLRIANPKPEKRRRPRRAAPVAAVLASSSSSSRRAGTEIDRDLDFDHYFPPDRWGSESSDAKGKRKARRTSVARPQTHHLDLSPSRPRPASASFKRSSLNRRVSKLARESSSETSARARPPSSMVATSFDPFTSFIGRIGRISLSVPRRKKPSSSRAPISSPIEAGAARFAAVPQLPPRIPFLGFSTGASDDDHKSRERAPLPNAAPQFAPGHTPSSSSASSTMPNLAAVLSLPPYLHRLDPYTNGAPATETLLPDHLQSPRASSSDSSHGGRSSADARRASSISSRSSKAASYRKPIPLHLFSPELPTFDRSVTEAITGDDGEPSTTRQFRSLGGSMQRESFDYHPSLRVRRLGAKWQAARSKAAPPAVASTEQRQRATAPAPPAVSVLGSSTSSSRLSLSSTCRVATSDYSSHSILNLDLEGASFSDLVRTCPFLAEGIEARS